MPEMRHQLSVVVFPSAQIRVGGEVKLCEKAFAGRGFHVPGVKYQAALEFQRGAAFEFVGPNEADVPVGQQQAVSAVVALQGKVLHHHVADYQTAHPVQRPRDVAHGRSRGTEEAPLEGVPSRAGASVCIPFRQVRGGDAVEAVEIMHHGVPIGEGAVEPHAGNEGGAVPVGVEIPGTFGGIGACKPHVVQEVGIAAAVAIVKEVRKNAQRDACVGAVAQIGQGGEHPPCLGLLLLYLFRLLLRRRRGAKGEQDCYYHHLSFHGRKDSNYSAHTTVIFDLWR